MMASPQMYDTSGLENLKKAALTVKVRSFLSQNGEIDPADLDNPELSLDLQSLIDDPNFGEVGENLFPELLHHHDKQGKAGGAEYSQLTPRNGHHGPNGHGVNGFNRNPLAYMPQPVHNGSSFNPNSANNNNNDIHVKEEPMDHRRITDFNANAVNVSDHNNPYYNNTLSSVTSPSSSSASSSQGYSPNAYIHHHHLTPATIPTGNDGLGGKGGSGSLNFNGKGLHHNHHHHHLSSSKKQKNVDKASDEYKRRRERNNIAVRKSREKAKMRSRETEERVKILSKENDRLQKKIDLLNEELTFLRSFFSNVGGLPEQIHREFNKHLETFQHHHIQNGINLQ